MRLNAFWHGSRPLLLTKVALFERRIYQRQDINQRKLRKVHLIQDMCCLVYVYSLISFKSMATIMFSVKYCYKESEESKSLLVKLAMSNRRTSLYCLLYSWFITQ